MLDSFQGLADGRVLDPLKENPETKFEIVSARDGAVLYTVTWKFESGHFYRLVRTPDNPSKADGGSLDGTVRLCEEYGEVAAAVRVEKDLALARRGDPAASLVIKNDEIKDEEG